MTKKEQIRSKSGKKGTTAPLGEAAKAHSPDKLTKAGKTGDIELDDDDLKGVSGGLYPGMSKIGFE